MSVDRETYWKQFDTPKKSIKNSLRSLKIFADYPDSAIDPVVAVIETAFAANKSRAAVVDALRSQSFVLITRNDILSTADFIMAGLRNSKHVA